jgi:hypothetical protein
MKKVCIFIVALLLIAALFGCAQKEFKDYTIENFIERFNNTLDSERKAIGDVEADISVGKMEVTTHKIDDGLSLSFWHNPRDDYMGIIMLELNVLENEEAAEDFGYYMVHMIQVSTNMDKEKAKDIFGKLIDKGWNIGESDTFTSREGVTYNIKVTDSIMSFSMLQG